MGCDEEGNEQSLQLVRETDLRAALDYNGFSQQRIDRSRRPAVAAWMLHGCCMDVAWLLHGCCNIRMLRGCCNIRMLRGCCMDDTCSIKLQHGTGTMSALHQYRRRYREEYRFNPYIVMAHIVMAQVPRGVPIQSLYSYGPYSYGPGTARSTDSIPI